MTQTADLTTIVCKNLNTFRINNDMSMREIARVSKVPHKTVAQILNGETSPTLKTLGKLCKGLRLDPSILVKC